MGVGEERIASRDLCRASKGARQGGFTLLEVAIYTAILAVVSSAMTMLVMGLERANAEGKMVNEILERSRTMVHEISLEYRKAVSTTISVQDAGKTLQFNLPNGFDGTGPVLGDQMRYRILADPADPTNGADDNGDGLVDEAILVRDNVTAGTSDTISHSLSYANSQFLNFGWGVGLFIEHMGITRGTDTVTRVPKRIYLTPRN